MPKQERDGPQITGALVNEHRLRATQGMRAELKRIEPDTCLPFGNEVGVLAGGPQPPSAGEQKFARLLARGLHIVVDSPSPLKRGHRSLLSWVAT